ncbi:MAG TPA: DUF5678 domain-containing protein [Chloroflexota bacterium]|jgi:hypothetical protein
MHVQDDPIQIQQELERHRRDAEYFQQHRQELLERYPDRWVAVYNQQVVGAAKHHKRLLRQLERKGIPAGFVLCDYLTDNADELILAAAS